MPNKNAARVRRGPQTFPLMRQDRTPAGFGPGTVIGPAVSVAGHLATFSGTDGTALTDSGETVASVVAAAVAASIASILPIDLTADVTNILPVSSGGSGAATFTSGGVLYGNGAGAFTVGPAKPGDATKFLDGQGNYTVPPGTGGLSGLTATRVPFATSATTIGDDADLTFVTDTLSVTKAVMSTSLTAPLVVGGTGVASTLTLQTTTGVGAAGNDVIFRNGNAGASVPLRIIYRAADALSVLEVNSPLWASDNMALTVRSIGANAAYFEAGGAGATVNIYFATPTFGGDIWQFGTGQIAVSDFGMGNATRGTTPLQILGGASATAGNIGFSVSGPTATLHLRAGTATASTAPLKFTSGTNLTTAEAGVVEYNGTNLFFTRAGTVRENVLVAIDNVAAPGTSIGVGIVNFYGSSATNFLGDPNRWLSVNVLGATYKIALYT